MKRRKANADRLVEAVLKGEPLPPGQLEDPSEVDELRAAIALKAARLGADLPSEEFVTRLRQELKEADEAPEKGPAFSRRALIATAGVAAGVAAGGIAGAVVDRTVLHPGSGHHQTALVPNEPEWVAVASAAELAQGTAKRFATPNSVGFVSEHAGELLAVSGVCTHLGCLLQQNNASGRLDCPCHRTSFALDGQVVFSQLKDQPGPLPTLTARRQGDSVEVLLPRQT
jgi:nitrite reductase/ring-hydroxylating ferredoxin subunit